MPTPVASQRKVANTNLSRGRTPARATLIPILSKKDLYLDLLKNFSKHLRHKNRLDGAQTLLTILATYLERITSSPSREMDVPTGYAALSMPHRLLLTLLGFYMAYLFAKNILFQPHVAILYAIVLFFRWIKEPPSRKEKLGVFLLLAVFDVYPDHSLWGYAGATVGVLVSGGVKNLVITVSRFAFAVARAYCRWLRFLLLGHVNQLTSSAITTFKNTTLFLVFFGHPDRRWEWFSLVLPFAKKMIIEDCENFTDWLAYSTKLPCHLVWSFVKTIVIDMRVWKRDVVRPLRRCKDAVVEDLVNTLRLPAVIALTHDLIHQGKNNCLVQFVVPEVRFRIFLFKSAFSVSLPVGECTTADASTQTDYHPQYNPLPVQLGWQYQRLVDARCPRCHADFINPGAYWCGRCKDLVVHNW